MGKDEFRTLQVATKTELDLFSVPPTQTSLEKGHWIDFQPVSSVSDGGPITFLVPGTEDYADLSKTILVVRAKVTKADGADLDADEKVGVVNNFLHSLFKQVDVFLKEKQVMQATGTYVYRAYLETLLNYGPATKKSQLTTSLFYKARQEIWRWPVECSAARVASTASGDVMFIYLCFVTSPISFSVFIYLCFVTSPIPFSVFIYLCFVTSPISFSVFIYLCFVTSPIPFSVFIYLCFVTSPIFFLCLLTYVL